MRPRLGPGSFQSARARVLVRVVCWALCWGVRLVMPQHEYWMRRRALDAHAHGRKTTLAPPGRWKEQSTNASWH
jgi:hypothetical protein